MSKVQPTTEGGGRKLSEDTKAKLRVIGQGQWAGLTEEQRAARLANLAKGRTRTPPAPPPSTDPPPSSGGSTNPLPHAPGAARASGPRSQGLNGHAAPPVFRVPDMPPLELGNGDAGAGVSGAQDDLGPSVGGPGIEVNVEQVATLLGFPFELVALRRGPHWKLRPDERAMVAEPLTRKINESAVAARAIGAGGDWLVIIGGLAILVSARIAEDRAHGTGTDRARGSGDGSGAGRGAPPPDDQPGDLGARPGPAGPGGGRLNGFVLGEGPAGGAEAAPATVPGGPLVQAL